MLSLASADQLLRDDQRQRRECKLRAFRREKLDTVFPRRSALDRRIDQSLRLCSQGIFVSRFPRSSTYYSTSACRKKCSPLLFSRPAGVHKTNTASYVKITVIFCCHILSDTRFFTHTFSLTLSLSLLLEDDSCLHRPESNPKDLRALNRMPVAPNLSPL
jgi:hypothetical protein